MITKFMMDVMSEEWLMKSIKCSDPQLIFDIIDRAIDKGCFITATFRPSDGYLCVAISRKNIDDQKEEA